MFADQDALTHPRHATTAQPPAPPPQTQPPAPLQPPATIATADILDELVAKAPTVASSVDRLDAAKDYIGRVRGAVVAVRQSIEAARTVLASSDMQQLRLRYAHSKPVGRDDSVVFEAPRVVLQQRTNAGPAISIRGNRCHPDLERIGRERDEDLERVLRTEGSLAELPKAAVVHLGDAVDGSALFAACEKELDAALRDVETRFAAQVLDTVTSELRKAKTGVLFSMFSERSTVGGM